MFNISKNTIWFVIIFASICCILLLFNSNQCCSRNYRKNDYNRYISYSSSLSHGSHLIPIVIDYDSNETSETIRKKQNRKHTESKKIFISPKSDATLISIKKIKKQLENKLKHNKNIKKQYETKNINQKVNNDENLTIDQVQNKPIQVQKTNQVQVQVQKPKPTQVQVQVQNKPIQVQVQNKPTVRLFSANWCGHCREFKPVWNELKKLYQNKINFIEIDCTKETPGLEYVQYLPTIAIYDKNDKYIENYEEDRSKHGFKNFLNYIANNI